MTIKTPPTETDIMDAMQPIEGMQRAVCKCDDCGQLFGRQYIPYGLGRGISINLCMCQLTANRPSTTVMKSSP